MNIKNIVLLIGSFFLIFACNKIHEQNPNPTKVNLNVPFHLGTKFKIPENNPLTKQGIDLGRMLFYDKQLSLDNTISCASCHKQQLAFTDGEILSKGVGGKTGVRNSMSLSNLIFLDSLFMWDGRAKSLEHQALFPIQDHLEMNQTLEATANKLQNDSKYPPKFKILFGSDVITSDMIAKVLAQFERTLISGNSKYDQHLMNRYVLSAQERNGMKLFLTHPVAKDGLRGGNCGDCHGGLFQTFNTMHNNGLDAQFLDSGFATVTKRATDMGKFRVPSLRNIAITAPYMHDGRFKTLEEVLDHYNEHINKSTTLDILIVAGTNNIGENSHKLGLTALEKKDIIAFLKTLTDSSFITNKEFSNPFEE